LTNHPVFEGDTHPTTDPAARAKMVKDQTYDLYLVINSLRLQLRRQINELHSHGIIPAQGTKPGTKFMRRPGRPGQGDEEARKAEEEERLKDPEMDVINGGLGDLDIAVLNARAGVRHQGDDEVLDRARAILKAMVRSGDANTDSMALDE
jgi:hypothetical protein